MKVDECPSIIMKVKKDLYLEIHESQFLRDEGDTEVWSKEKLLWTTEKCYRHNGIIKAGRFLLFRDYRSPVISSMTDENKRDGVIIIMSEIDCLENKKFPLGTIDICPCELNNLIKEDAIEII